MPRSRRRGGEVAALGEDHERVVLVEAAWPARRSAPRGPRPAAGLGEMNRAGIRCRTTSIAGSQARVSLRTTRGSRSYQCISAWISVNESPGPGVPAADQQRRARVRVRASGPSVSIRSAQHPPGLAEEHPHHALHQVVVDALEVRRPDPPAEARGEPEPEQDDQQQRSRRSGRGSSTHSSRSARQPAGQQRRERGGRRSARAAAVTQQHRGQRDHRRRDHAAAGSRPGSRRLTASVRRGRPTLAS